MDIKERARHAIDSQIDSCNDQYEVWKENHKFAMLVFDIDDLLRDMVKTHKSIDSLHQDFVDRVTEDSRTYTPESDSEIHDLCAKWLDLARRVKVNLLDVCKNEGYTLDNEAIFIERLRLAEESEKVGFDAYAIQQYEVWMPSLDDLSSCPAQ